MMNVIMVLSVGEVRMSDDRDPKHSCKKFMSEHSINNPERLIKAEFDQLAKSKSFKEGPFSDSFGDGPGEPYNPYRQAFGILNDGRGVFCEIG